MPASVRKFMAITVTVFCSRYFSIVAKGAKTAQKEKFVSVIRNCLQDIVRNGIDKKAILAGINYMEFRYREADFGQFPKGSDVWTGYYGKLAL